MFITNHNRFPADMWMWVFLIRVMTFNYLFNQRHGALLDTRLKTEEWLIVNWPHWLNWLYNFCVEQQNEYTAARQVISVVSGLASTEHSIIWFTLNLTLEASSWEKQTFSQLGRFNCQTEYCKNRQVNYWVFNSPPSYPRSVNFKYWVLKSPKSLSFTLEITIKYFQASIFAFLIVLSPSI